MKIYTKGGDDGTTSLFGGRRVDKNSLRIDAYGNVDELNSLIGVIVSDIADYSSRRSREVTQKNMTVKDLRTLEKKLLRIQRELFVLGSDLATPLDVKTKVPRVNKSGITRLEKEIDAWQKDLPLLKKFILPGGHRTAAKLHLARSVARRTERSIISLSNQEKINKNTVAYINRLSDWFFVAARHINSIEKIVEVTWKGRG